MSGKYDLVLPDDVLENASTSVYMAKFSEERWKAEGEVPAGSALNPTKKTPSSIEVLDRGSVELLEDSPEFKKLLFSGKKLKGAWTVRKRKGSTLWSMSRSQGPGRKRTNDGEAGTSEQG